LNEGKRHQAIKEEELEKHPCLSLQSFGSLPPPTTLCAPFPSLLTLSHPLGPQVMAKASKRNNFARSDSPALGEILSVSPPAQKGFKSLPFSDRCLPLKPSAPVRPEGRKPLMDQTKLGHGVGKKKRLLSSPAHVKEFFPR